MTRIPTLALILDADGVVILGRPVDGARWTQDLQRDLAIDPGFLTTAFFRGPFQDALRGRADVRSTLASLLDSPERADELIAYWFQHDSNLNGSLLEYVAELRAQRSCDVFLATNQDHRRAAHIWNELCLCDWFDGMVYSAELGACKPEKRFFAATHAKLDLDRYSKTLFVDDQESNVEAAQRAGWDAELFETTEDLQHYLSREIGS